MTFSIKGPKSCSKTWLRSDSDIKHTLENIAADGDRKPFQKAKDHRCPVVFRYRASVPTSMDLSRIVAALVAWLAFITMLSGRNRWCNLRFKFFDVNVEFLMLLLFHVFNPLSSPFFRRRKSFTEQSGRRRDGA